MPRYSLVLEKHVLRVGKSGVFLPKTPVVAGRPGVALQRSGGLFSPTHASSLAIPNLLWANSDVRSLKSLSILERSALQLVKFWTTCCQTPSLTVGLVLSVLA